MKGDRRNLVSGRNRSNLADECTEKRTTDFLTLAKEQRTMLENDECFISLSLTIPDALTLLSRTYFSSSLRNTFSSLVRSRLPLIKTTSFHNCRFRLVCFWGRTAYIWWNGYGAVLRLRGSGGIAPCKLICVIFPTGKKAGKCECVGTHSVLGILLANRFRFAGSDRLRAVGFEPITPFPAIALMLLYCGDIKRK